MNLFHIFSFLMIISFSVGQIPVNLFDLLPQDRVYDYIIVGGGSGGSTVAGRLSEYQNYKVLLIEAGGYPDWLSYVPSLKKLQSSNPENWQYPIQPQTAGFTSELRKKFNYVQGKVLGGSSNINGMLYVRGSSYSFDNWAKLGLTDWSYEKVLPAFLKSEGNTIPGLLETYHNSSGPLTISRPSFQTSSLNNFLQAAQENGLLPTDYNGANQSGVSPLDFTIRNGTRCSTYTAFIDTNPIKTNLYLATHTTVTKVLIEQNIAVGVQVLVNGQSITVNASKEVILSAGSLASPKILMLSGIGPKEQLQKFNIPVLVELPGVGENLQDHLGTSLNWKVNCSNCTYNPLAAFSLKNIFNYLFYRQGPLAYTAGVEGVIFTSTNKSNPSPDLQLLYISYALPNVALLQPIYTALKLVSASFTIPLSITQPKSVGYVHLNSSEPTAYPIVNFNYLSDQRDADVLIAGAKLAKMIGDSAAFKSLGAEFIPASHPGCEAFQLFSDEYWNCTVRGSTILLYHPVGTCKMGLSSDPMAVVDSQLRVLGVKNLRVADASIMPIISAGNTNAPTIMIGERAAEFIMSSSG